MFDNVTVILKKAVNQEEIFKNIKKKLAFRFLKSHFHVKLNLFERLIQTAFLLTYRFSKSNFLTTVHHYCW